MQISRRVALASIGASLVGCAIPSENTGPSEGTDRDPNLAPPEGADTRDGVDALCAILLPTERDTKGQVTRPGAAEANVSKVLRLDTFVPLAIAQGLLPALPPSFVDATKRAGAGLRDAVGVTLDAIAAVDRPGARFVDLAEEVQTAVVARAFDDPVHAPAMLVVRAACFTAWLGAITNDLGLRAVGFPPFEDFDARLACSGYPRKNADGSVDDYTYDRAPPPTTGDDLSLVLDANGDLA